MKGTFDLAEKLIVVRALVLGPQREIGVKLALDTGATRTVIGLSTLILAGYDIEGIQEKTRITTASGKIWAPQLMIKKLTAIDLTCEDMTVSCHELPVDSSVDGLLGLDFFKGKCLTIDFRQGRLNLD